MLYSTKTVVLILLSIFAFFIGNAQTDYATTQLVKRLADKLEHRQYFELKKIYDSYERRLPSSYALFFGAHVDAAFNAPAESNRKITELLKHPAGTIEPTDMLGLLSVKQQNHIHLFEYQQAWQTSKFITSTYRDKMSEADLENYSNTEKLWEAILHAPPQEIEQKGDVLVDLPKDKADLFRIEMSLGGMKKRFVFDTGANFSVMQHSVAQKLGLQIIEANFLTTAATGKQVESDVAIVPELKIGGLTIRHAVFIIFDDQQLQFPENDYEIEGIIGFPIIRAMKEIHIGQENTLFIPENKSKLPTKNLALDGLFPVVEVNCNDVALAFHFDTGANITMLYPRYYERFQQKIDKKYTPESFKATSAGGEVESKGFVLKKVKFKLGEQSVKLKNVRLLTDEHHSDETVYGNLGQDFFSQFKGYVLNFEHSCFWLE